MNLGSSQAPTFIDVQFMTALEKTRAHRDWCRLVQHVCQSGVSVDCPRAFTQAVYNQLHQHCGFIAHYDLSGFWSAQLSTASRALAFFRSITDGISDWGLADYSDLNRSMEVEVRKHWAALSEKLTCAQRDDAVRDIKAIAAAAGLKIDATYLMSAAMDANNATRTQPALF